MKLTIHDVGHGQCISLISGTSAMLWDCGSENGNTPSSFLSRLGVKEITMLTVTNYDEDHINDLPALKKNFNINSLLRNKSITADQLRKLKLAQSGTVSPAMEILLTMMRNYNSPVTEEEKTLRNITFPIQRHIYKNNYGIGVDQFEDTNNISLVTYLKVKNTTFLIPGDIEKQGWEVLLKNQYFKSKLKTVNVFVASHHGRENGYCESLFGENLCQPDVFVFSDSSIEYGTQERMAEKYAKHVKGKGVIFNEEYRKVLTTRRDGSIIWDFS